MKATFTLLRSQGFGGREVHDSELWIRKAQGASAYLHEVFISRNIEYRIKSYRQNMERPEKGAVNIKQNSPGNQGEFCRYFVNS